MAFTERAHNGKHLPNTNKAFYLEQGLKTYEHDASEPPFFSYLPQPKSVLESSQFEQNVIF